VSRLAGRGPLLSDAQRLSEERHQAYYRLMSTYVPPKIDTDVLCIVCDEHRNDWEFSPLIWRRVARHVGCEFIPGDHHTCVTTYRTELAERLRRLVRSPACSH
jgi:hypothetical protein